MQTTQVHGCLRIEPFSSLDSRGRFSKVYSSELQRELDEPMHWRECFWTHSKPGVVRGMHFQLPPSACSKLVWCVAGSAFDVVLDLRIDSPTYRAVATFTLDAENRSAVFVPAGCAHGFATGDVGAVMCYLTDRDHDPSLDSGVRWDSLPIDWSVPHPEVSLRDAALPSIEDFESPFRMRTSHGN